MSEENTNPLDAQIIDWDNDASLGSETENTNERKNSARWMSFKEPGKYTVRLVGNGIKFRRWWQPFDFKDRVITHDLFRPSKDKDQSEVDPAWKAGFYPKTTYAIICIDRADGEVKILEKGKQIFDAFKDWQDANNKKPGGKQAPDFQIKLEWPQGNKRAANYSVTSAGDSKELTEEEKEKVRKFASEVDLKELYRATSLEKIKELWDAIPEDQKVPETKDKESTSSNNNSTPIVEDNGGDDLFGSDDDDSNSF